MKMSPTGFIVDFIDLFIPYTSVFASPAHFSQIAGTGFLHNYYI